MSEINRDKFNALDDEHKYSGQFFVDLFEQYLGKCKSPKIFISTTNLIHVAQRTHGGKESNSINDILLAFLVKSHFNEVPESIERVIDHIEKVNLQTKTYNLYGIRVPIELTEDDEYIVIVDQGTNETYMIRIWR